MSWLEKIRPQGLTTQKKDRTQSVPEGLWKKCPKCSAPLYRPELERNMDVCPKCSHHMRIGAR
ncbi:MAG: acetyl-CoA carboxylase carboxyl transferase subunit beta, partial [Porticoccaceae bacterium]|nr:acetyl-CoA carboxylase carboxyl transferase subunit beta [Porticoccaceae bacterium]